MATQDSDSVKAIKALEDVEKHLQGVKARAQRGATWAWQHDGVTYIDVYGFQAVTDRARKAIEDAAPLFEVYLHALGRVPPRFKAVFEQAAALLNWIGSLEDQHGGEYIFASALQRLRRVALGLQDICTPPVKAQAARPQVRKTAAARRLESPELQAVKEKLTQAGIIKGGKWQGTPAEFGCLVAELHEQHNVSSRGARAWKDVARWAGYEGNTHSARAAIESNPNTRGPIADKIRAICRATK